MKPGKLHSAWAETGRGAVFGKNVAVPKTFTDFSLGLFSVISTNIFLGYRLCSNRMRPWAGALSLKKCPKLASEHRYTASPCIG